MRTFTISLLGRRFRFESNLSAPEVETLASRVANGIARYTDQYPNADRLDILFFCLIDLSEQLVTLERALDRHCKAEEMLRRRISQIRILVEDELKKLTDDAPASTIKPLPEHEGSGTSGPVG